MNTPVFDPKSTLKHLVEKKRASQNASESLSLAYQGQVRDAIKNAQTLVNDLVAWSREATAKPEFAKCIQDCRQNGFLELTKFVNAFSQNLVMKTKELSPLPETLDRPIALFAGEFLQGGVQTGIAQTISDYLSQYGLNRVGVTKIVIEEPDLSQKLEDKIRGIIQERSEFLQDSRVEACLKGLLSFDRLDPPEEKEQKSMYLRNSLHNRAGATTGAYSIESGSGKMEKMDNELADIVSSHIDNLVYSKPTFVEKLGRTIDKFTGGSKNKKTP